MNPLTGKKALNLVSNEELFPTSFQQYGTFLQENKVIAGTTDAKKVELVGVKIKAAAERYLASIGQTEYLKGYQWEYKLVQSPDVNAWCMPGGKIVVYSGILPITKDDAGLATVMGHEVSHALANHGAQENNNPKEHIPNNMDCFFIVNVILILTKIQLLSLS